MTNEEVVQALRDIKNELKQDMTTIQTKVDTLYERMFVGNGKPSLTERLTLVENEHKNCPARKAALNESKVLRISMVMLLIAIITLILNYSERRSKNEANNAIPKITNKDAHVMDTYEPSTRWLHSLR